LLFQSWKLYLNMKIAHSVVKIVIWIWIFLNSEKYKLNSKNIIWNWILLFQLWCSKKPKNRYFISEMGIWIWNFLFQFIKNIFKFEKGNWIWKLWFKLFEIENCYFNLKFLFKFFKKLIWKLRFFWIIIFESKN